MNGYGLILLIFVIISAIAIYKCKKDSDDFIKRIKEDNHVFLEREKFLTCARNKNVIYCKGCKNCPNKKNKAK